MYMEKQEEYEEFIKSIKRHKKIKKCFSTILKSVSNAVIATNLYGNIKYMNPLSEDLTGWKEDEAEGRPWEDLFKIVKEKTSKGVETLKIMLISKNGMKIPIEFNISVAIDDDGFPKGFFLMFKEIH
jgi:PAS domain S-box-containing protein